MRNFFPQPRRWNERANGALTNLQAFDAMRMFLEEYWERGGKTDEEIAALLGSLNRVEDHAPLDAAQWDDWLGAVDRILKSKAN